MTISAIKGCPNKEVPKHPGTHAHTAYAHWFLNKTVRSYTFCLKDRGKQDFQNGVYWEYLHDNLYEATYIEIMPVWSTNKWAFKRAKKWEMKKE